MKPSVRVEERCLKSIITYDQTNKQVRYELFTDRQLGIAGPELIQQVEKCLKPNVIYMKYLIIGIQDHDEDFQTDSEVLELGQNLCNKDIRFLDGILDIKRDMQLNTKNYRKYCTYHDSDS